MKSGDPHHEVVLPCMDHVFGGVGAVHVRGGALEFQLFCWDECFNIMGNLVVHFLEEGPISLGREPGVHLCDNPED